MRWLPFILIFLLIYIEISLFIKVASIVGVLMALLLIIATSFLGVSLIRAQGIKTLTQMQQKMMTGENPAPEMIKSVSLLVAGFLLIIPGFFTDILALLLLLPFVQRILTLKIMPHFRVYTTSSSSTTYSSNHGETIEGEFSRKDDDDKRIK